MSLRRIPVLLTVCLLGVTAQPARGGVFDVLVQLRTEGKAVTKPVSLVISQAGSPDLEVPLLDNGKAPDDKAGDGIFSGQTDFSGLEATGTLHTGTKVWEPGSIAFPDYFPIRLLSVTISGKAPLFVASGRTASPTSGTQKTGTQDGRDVPLPPGGAAGAAGILQATPVGLPGGPSGTAPTAGGFPGGGLPGGGLPGGGAGGPGGGLPNGAFPGPAGSGGLPSNGAPATPGTGPTVPALEAPPSLTPSGDGWLFAALGVWVLGALGLLAVLLKRAGSEPVVPVPEPEPGLVGAGSPSPSEGLLVWAVPEAELADVREPVLGALASRGRVLVVAPEGEGLPQVYGGPVYRATSVRPTAVGDFLADLQDEDPGPISVLTYAIPVADVDALRKVLPPGVGGVALCAATGEVGSERVECRRAGAGWTLLVTGNEVHWSPARAG